MSKEPNTFQIEFRNISNKKDYWLRVWLVIQYAKSLNFKDGGHSRIEEQEGE